MYPVVKQSCGTWCTDLLYVWIGVQTNYYVPLAAVISDITHELGNTGCRHFMCIFVRDYYIYIIIIFLLSSILLWTSVLCIANV